MGMEAETFEDRKRKEGEGGDEACRQKDQNWGNTRGNNLRSSGSVPGRFCCASGVRISLNILENLVSLTSMLIHPRPVLNNDLGSFF